MRLRTAICKRNCMSCRRSILLSCNESDPYPICSKSTPIREGNRIRLDSLLLGHSVILFSGRCVPHGMQINYSVWSGLLVIFIILLWTVFLSEI
jgi:hypothetical protein